MTVVTTPSSILGDFRRRADARGWTRTVEAGIRLARLTLFVGLGLTAAVLVVALWGRQFVLQRIENTYVELQRKASADQARRIARLLEQELAAGVPATTVRRHLQDSLSRSPYDDAGFLCLLDDRATVLCHPDAGAIGMRVPFAAGATIPAAGADSVEWLGGQDYAGDTHLVARVPVRGAPWQVSVHANSRAIQARVQALRHQITMAALPLLAGFVLLGTLTARVAGRAYERKIEESNRALESKVASRTAELATASRYHREIIEAAPSAIFLSDAQGTIRHANAQAGALVGRPAAELKGRAIDQVWEWHHGPGRTPGASRLDAREARLRAAGGADRHLHVFTRTLKPEHGGETMFVVQDVTGLKTLEREFQQAQKMEAVGQLAGGVAHDFNNLLGAILGFTELARMRSSEPVVREHLGRALDAVQRAGRISQQLLAFSRKQVLEPQPGRLPGLVDEVRKVLERVLGEGVEIETSHQASPWGLRVDPTQFEQALLNLAINARDAMEGQGRLLLRTRNVPAGTESRDHNRCLLADCVCLEVEDNGPGIPPEIRERIFEPFFTTKAPGKGTGLGLASVQGIVQQHGGHIELHSEPGRGTRFALYFPRIEDAGEHRTASRAPALVPGRGRRLLIVEDDPTLLESLCALLEARDYRCTGCATRAEAIEQLARGHRFDNVVSDVVMPGPSLARFLEEVRLRAPAVPIVLMSGYAAGQAFEEARAANLPILRKPFSLDQLGALLSTAPHENPPP